MKKRPSTPATLLKLAVLFVIATAQAPQSSDCRIDDSLLDMLTSRFQKLTTGPSGQAREVYVANVPFIDGVTKTNLLSVEGALIDKAVRNGMHEAAKSNPNLLINQAGHTVPNNARTVLTLVDIYFDPDLSLRAKFEKVNEVLLIPNKVHILITGVIIDSGHVIRVRPFGVSQPDKNIKSKDLHFTGRDELFQTVGGTLMLTSKAHEDISLAVKSILEEN